LNSFVVFRLDFSTLKPNFLVPMQVLNACVNLDHMKIKTCMFQQLSKPLKMYGT
jgi:hypothetical protein